MAASQAALGFQRRSSRWMENLPRYLLVATAVVALAACAGDAVSPDGTVDAKHRKGGTTPPPPPTPDPTPTPIPVGVNPIAGAAFWVNPYSNAQKTADSWRAARPGDAAQMDKIAQNSQAQWLGSLSGDIYTAGSHAVATPGANGPRPVFVAHNIPQRDCGGPSPGGTNPDGFQTWVPALAERAC